MKCEIYFFLICEAINTVKEQLTDKSHGDQSPRTNIRETFVLWKSVCSKNQKAYTDVEYLDRLSLGQVTASGLLKESQEPYRAWRVCRELQTILGWASPFLPYPCFTSHLQLACSIEVKSMGTGLWQSGHAFRLCPFLIDQP